MKTPFAPDSKRNRIFAYVFHKKKNKYNMRKIFLAIALLIGFQQINAQTEHVTIIKSGSGNDVKNTYNPMCETTVHLPVVSTNDEDITAPATP